LLLAIAGCVDQTDFPTELAEPSGPIGTADTSYVPLTPIWNSAGGVEFSHPHGVTFGYDRSVYICDTDNDRVLRLSVTGELLAEYDVPHPVQLTQDRQLNLICVDGVGSVYRNEYFGDGAFEQVIYRDSVSDFVEVDRLDSLGNVVTDTVEIVKPSGLLGVAASPFPDRRYYLPDTTRDVIALLDVTDRGLAADIFVAFARSRAVDPIGMLTYAVNETDYHLAFTQWARNAPFRIVENDSYAEVVLDTTDIYNALPAGHKQLARDIFGNFYVVAELTHRVYRFSPNGALFIDFGGRGAGTGNFQAPKGIAWGEGVLYVADTDNNRIMRFILSTDTQE
jgi:hypothetical protein